MDASEPVAEPRLPMATRPYSAMNTMLNHRATLAAWAMLIGPCPAPVPRNRRELRGAFEEVGDARRQRDAPDVVARRPASPGRNGQPRSSLRRRRSADRI